MPIKQCEQIIIAGKAVSLSSDIVYLCVKEGIAIDYVDHKELPYATIFGYKSTFANMMLLQLELYNSEKRVTLAKYFVKGKAKNQLNYLKYLDKYHNEIEDKIELIEKKIPNIKKAKSVSVLMGIEGEIATTYWSAISYILRDKADFKTRVHKNAKDLVNSALNYGYAILYSKVRHALLKASLALNIPFLHSIQENKPALVYDFIEEYRAYIVDRAIISMFNKNEPIKLDNQNLLTKESRELIVKNIYERLGVYAKYRSQNKKVSNIIQDQAYLLARAVKNEAKYKPFIAKY
jgi:CRISPR-associated endonuclease Cas1